MSFKRLLTAVIAFVIASMAVAVALVIGVLAPDFSWGDSDPIERVRFFASAFLATGYGPLIALVLALGGVVLAEAKGIRSVLYYIVAGALIGFVSSWSVDLSVALENTTDIAPVNFAKTIATVAGIVGGMVYWAIAGRRAGNGRSPAAITKAS
jgi:hypothetical protein